MEARALGRAIIDSLSDPQLFARFFTPADSWLPWRAVLRVLFGLPLPAEDMALFRSATGRTRPFTAAILEAWLLCGRRSGKSRILALIAVCLATFREYSAYLAPGERPVVMVL